MDQNDIHHDTIGAEEGADDTINDAQSESQRGARLLALAGIGAVAAACDTANEQFDRFVDRGEQFKDEWRRRADDVRRENAGARGRVRSYFRSAMDAFLDGINVPNKTDVDTINVKLNILTRKIDDLQMQGIQRDATVPPPSAPEPPTMTTGDLTT